MSHFVIILAAGKGSRLNNGKIPKQFLELSNLPMVMHSIIAFNKAIPQAKIEVDLTTYNALGSGEKEVVYSYNYEVARNEAKRDIKLISRNFVADILTEHAEKLE